MDFREGTFPASKKEGANFKLTSSESLLSIGLLEYSGRRRFDLRLVEYAQTIMYGIRVNLHESTVFKETFFIFKKPFFFVKCYLTLNGLWHFIGN